MPNQSISIGLTPSCKNSFLLNVIVDSCPILYTRSRECKDKVFSWSIILGPLAYPVHHASSSEASCFSLSIARFLSFPTPFSPVSLPCFPLLLFSSLPYLSFSLLLSPLSLSLFVSLLVFPYSRKVSLILSLPFSCSLLFDLFIPLSFSRPVSLSSSFSSDHSKLSTLFTD
jgi:hypothetical protein